MNKMMLRSAMLLVAGMLWMHAYADVDAIKLAQDIADLKAKIATEEAKPAYIKIKDAQWGAAATFANVTNELQNLVNQEATKQRKAGDPYNTPIILSSALGVAGGDGLAGDSWQKLKLKNQWDWWWGTKKTLKVSYDGCTENYKEIGHNAEFKLIPDITKNPTINALKAQLQTLIDQQNALKATATSVVMPTAQQVAELQAKAAAGSASAAQALSTLQSTIATGTPTAGGSGEVTGTPGFLWGIDKNNIPYFRAGMSTDNPMGNGFVSVEGKAKHISVSERGNVWIIDINGVPNIRVGTASDFIKGFSWKPVPAPVKMTKIITRGYQVWALGDENVTGGNSVWLRKGITDSNREGTEWMKIDGGLTNIAISSYDTLWGSNNNGDVFSREGITPDKPEGLSWRQMASDKKIKQLVVGDNCMWGLGFDNAMYSRHGISEVNPAGDGWIMIQGEMAYLSLSDAGQLWGLKPDGSVNYRQNITDDNPVGQGWLPVTGNLIQLDGGHFMIPLNPPADFDDEEGELMAVAVGSRNSELEMWGIGMDGVLYRFDNYSMDSNPWRRLEPRDANNTMLALPLRHVSVSSDGIMLILDAQGKVHQYDWDKKIFNKLDAGAGNENIAFEFVAVGNKDNFWAVDVDSKTLYQYVFGGKGWDIRSQNAIYVSAGYDSTVVAINERGELFSYRGNSRWQQMPGIILDRIAVVDSTKMWGINDNFIIKFKNGEWKHVEGRNGKNAEGFEEIAVNGADTLLATDLGNAPYTRGDDGVEMPKGEPPVIPPAVVTVPDTQVPGGPKVDQKPEGQKAKPAAKKPGKKTRKQGKKEGKVKRAKGLKDRKHRRKAISAAKEVPSQKQKIKPSKKVHKKPALKGAVIKGAQAPHKKPGVKKGAKKKAHMKKQKAPGTPGTADDDDDEEEDDDTTVPAPATTPAPGA